MLQLVPYGKSVVTPPIICASQTKCVPLVSTNSESDRMLWMGDLRSYMSEEFIRDAFVKMGVQLVNVRVITDKNTHHEKARQCMLRLCGRVIPHSDPPVRFNLSFANNPAAGVKEFNLFVNNLPSAMDDAELYQLFGRKYLSCRGAKVYRSYDGSSRRMGFIRFSDETDQQRALVEMNRVRIHGRPISLKLAPPRTSTPRSATKAAVVSASCSSYYPNYCQYGAAQPVVPNYPYNCPVIAVAPNLPVYVPTPKFLTTPGTTSVDDYQLEDYDDHLSLAEANEQFMESSYEFYESIGSPGVFPELHTALVNCDDLIWYFSNDNERRAKTST
ncbi:unnamed protein product [Soboliphyme baturini]|uniref:tRNA selenocysteine-associated protein 1 n=1 Tax=Soboliphyme baturini TaxID=241478 RepID=A0A183IRX5_9BILA|nr:unnamed protein product [Soboliphyme baturini]